MRKTFTLIIVLLAAFQVLTEDNVKITTFSSYPHQKNCYTQGIFFLNETHLFQSCGLYDKSYFHVLKYENGQKEFKTTQTFKSKYPIDETVFLQGATYFSKTNKIYILTWRQRKVYKLNRESFGVEQVLRWQKDGWGLTSNETHMFATDGSDKIYIIDQDFKIIDQKLIIDQKGRRLYSINELEYVVENGKPFIYANVYMERRIVKIDLQKKIVVKQYDLLKVIQNQKGLKYDEVINGIAFDSATGEFILSGKNWGNFYRIHLD